MTRLVVTSPTTALASDLSAAGYQVVQLEPEAFEAWRGSGVGIDAFVLDLRSAALALAAVTRLRSRVALVPVLLVATDQPGWDGSELRELPATRVLPSPGGDAAVLSALTDLAVEPWATREALAGPATAPGERQAVRDAMGELALDTLDLLSDDDDLDARVTALRPPEPEPPEPPRHARDDRSN